MKDSFHSWELANAWEGLLKSDIWTIYQDLDRFLSHSLIAYVFAKR